VTGDETWGFHQIPESKQAGKNFDDDDEVVQRAGGRLLCLGDAEAGSST